MPLAGNRMLQSSLESALHEAIPGRMARWPRCRYSCKCKAAKGATRGQLLRGSHATQHRSTGRSHRRRMTARLAACAELLQRFAGLNFAEAVWWRVGAAKAAGEDLNYLGVGGFYIAGGQGIIIIAICQVLHLTLLAGTPG